MADERSQPDPVPVDSNDESGAISSGLDAMAVEAPESAPDSAAEPSPPASGAADESADALAQLQRERDEMRERWLRAAAELDNFRKRMRKEIEDVRLYAVAGLLRDLLEVLDNFERAVISMQESTAQEGELDNLRSGVALIHQRFREILLSQGLERIEAEGAEFDPGLHEAILQVEKEGVAPGQITEVVQPGYRLRELVIRPCRVIVAR